MSLIILGEGWFTSSVQAAMGQTEHNQSEYDQAEYDQAEYIRTIRLSNAEDTLPDTAELDELAVVTSVQTAGKEGEAVVGDEVAEVGMEFGLTARSAVLMEASTGMVIYELNGDEQLSPASITKIMTLILIFEALEEGRIALEDSVSTSAYAKSMGGSQVFLEEGEIQSVETMIKCIVIASGNDASVAMAEHLAGSESEFVRQMNEKAV